MIQGTWGEIAVDADGCKSQTMYLYGAVAGQIEQFPENAPTTYATVGSRRLGPRSSWDEAKAAVQKSLLNFTQAER